MNDSIHEEIVELLAPYALGALEPHEKAMVEAHLQECAYCRTIAQQDSAVVHSIGMGSTEHKPPRGLKRELFAKIDVISSKKPIATPARGFSSFMQSQRWAFASAIIAPIVVLGGMVAFLVNRVGDVQTANTELSRVVETKEQENNALSQSISDQSQTLSDQRNALAWASQAAFRKDIRSSGPARGSTGNLYVNTSGRMGMLVINDLQRLPTDRLFQVWLIGWDNSVIGAGTFTSDTNGRGQIVMESDLPLFAYKSLAVTIEPGPGSQQPTGPQIFGVEF